MYLKIGHLYPYTLSLYGDRGNILALKKRCLWRNIQVFVTEMDMGEVRDLSSFDLLFLGGGQDRDQVLAAEDLLSRKGELKEALAEKTVLLAICGGYQILGHSYQTQEETIKGVHLLDIHTRAGSRRLIGNVAITVTCFPEEFPLVGFENHSGRTYLGEGVQPLGQVQVGAGNNGEDGSEGCRQDTIFASYLHGPLLPKNPRFTDYLLEMAVKRRYPKAVLSPLDDSLEAQAQKRAQEVAQAKR